MNQTIVDYLNTQRVAVLAIEMMDGSPHGATVHFAHSENPFVFYFETNRNYKKSEPLFGREKSRASLVIGTSETDMKTFQLDGLVERMTEEERPEFDAVYLAKFGEKKKKFEDAEYVFFKFTPSWWRYTDFRAPEGKLILTSN